MDMGASTFFVKSVQADKQIVRLACLFCPVYARCCVKKMKAFDIKGFRVRLKLSISDLLVFVNKKVQRLALKKCSTGTNTKIA